MSRQWQAYKQVAFRALNERGTGTLLCLNNVPTRCSLFHISVMKELAMFHRLVRTDNISLPGLWLYFCGTVSSYSGIVCNLDLRKCIIVVKDENVGKQDLQGVLFGWSGI